ncbi:MAG: nuclear transport factor 2 family protein [Anaerolineae bacterium]|nr:nuclear transport factor 2 family protein [Anaerolineae bacterium]
MRVTFTVNHQSHTLDLEPRVLLVDVLRDHLHLTGVKIGCDTGQCGACVVLMDGVSVKSCALLGVQADGSSITTIEGVSEKGTMNPLQTAFQAAHAVQCGFCTPGMIMSLTDLLARSAQPSEAEIRAWLAGNLCRCTGYENVVRAVNAALQVAGSPAHLVTETPLRKFYDSHLRAMLAGDVDALVDAHYSADAVLTTFEGVISGRDALKTYFRDYLSVHTDLVIAATERFVEFGDSIYTETVVRSARGVTHAYNAFVVQDGRVTHQFAGVK